MGRWEEQDHTADLALRIWGDDLPDLFATAAKGMVSLLVVLEETTKTLAESIELTAPDVEVLLVDWLNELLYLGERGATLTVYTDFKFRELTPTYLRAVAHGRKVDHYDVVIKAATFHNLVVRKVDKGYETEIVFDT